MGRPKGGKNRNATKKGNALAKGRVRRAPHIVVAEKIEIAAKRKVNAEKKAEKDARVAEQWQQSIEQFQKNPDNDALIEIAFERIRKDPAWWFTEYVYTNDPGDDEMREKKFPMEKGYFDFMFNVLLQDKIVFAAKSSKVLASWFAAGLCVWKALFFKHSECYVQCFNEKAVAYFIKMRMKMIYDRLPDWQKKPNTTFTFCYMDIPDMGSFVEGIPSGVDKIRGRAPSLFVMDEVAFIPDAGQAVAAALPRVLGDAMFFGVSTPNMKNFFYKRLHPKKRKLLEEYHPIEGWPKTVVRRHEGQSEIFLHYTADPDKRSPEWKKQAYQKMLEEGEGKGEEAWEQEMELSFEVTGLPKLYPSYDPAIHEADVEFNPRWPVIVGLDFGYGYPACVFLQHNRETDQIIALNALLLEKCDIDEFAEIVLNYQNMHFKPETDDGVKRHIKYRYFGDHSGTHQRDTGNNAKILRKRHGIGMRSRFSKPEERTQLIRTRMRIRKNGTPGMLVNRKCHLLTEGFRGAFSSKKDLMGNPTGIPFKDGIYDNVHDALGYPIDNLFGVPRSPELIKDRKRRSAKRRKELERRYRDSVTGYSPAMA